MKIEDFDKYFNHTTDTYEFFKEDFEKILKGIIPAQKGIIENGIKILKIMQDKIDQYNNIFTSKKTASSIFLTTSDLSLININ